MVEATPLEHHLEMQVKHERELREEQKRSSELALRLQAVEYERRLDTLNGEHGRLAEITGTFLRQETFTAWLKSREDADNRMREADLLWKRTVDKQLSEQRGANNRTMALITIVIAALSLLLRFWP